MNKTFLVFVSAILLIGMVSASPLGNLLNNSQATNLSVAISPHSTTVNFYLDTTGSSLDNISTTMNGQSISFLLSNFLSGIKNTQTNLSDGTTSPIFSHVDLSNNIVFTLAGISSAPTPFWKVYNTLIANGINFTGDSTQDGQALTDLASKYPLPTKMVGNAVFTKSGNYYTVTYDKGFGDVPADYISQIQGIVNTYSQQSFNVTNLITNYIFPISQVSDSLKSLLGDNLNNFNYNVSLVDISQFDLSNLKDGTYNIPVTFKVGTETINKNVQVTLSGIPSINTYYRLSDNICATIDLYSVEKTSNDYLTQTDCEAQIIKTDYSIPLTNNVSEWISGLKNIPSGVTITATILDITSTIDGTSMVNINPLKIIKIDLSADSTLGGDIYFSIDKSSVSNPNKVSLYVLDGTTWTKLTTTYLSGSDTATEYTYFAHTPHFSTFMIGEDTTSTSSGSSGGSGGGTDTIGSSSFPSTSSLTTTNNNAVTTPISTENPTETTPTTGTSSPITGGVIGFIQSGAGIASILVLMVVVAGAVVLVVVKRRK